MPSDVELVKNMIPSVSYSGDEAAELKPVRARRVRGGASVKNRLGGGGAGGGGGGSESRFSQFRCSRSYFLFRFNLRFKYEFFPGA